MRLHYPEDIYFTRGIMAHFNNEAELMGMLGHEVGHVAARHSVAQQRNQLFGQLGLIAGLELATDLAPFAESAQQGLGLLFLKFGRDAERYSDELGVESSSRLRYDANEMAGFFKTLERKDQKSGQMIPEFLSTHPNPGNRFVTVGELAKDDSALMILTLAEGQNSQDAASAALQKYKLNTVESSPVNVNGLEALMVIADQPQQSGTVRTVSYFIRHNGAIYHIIGATALNSYDRYSNAFGSNMNGFKVLADANKINRKPERIQIRQVNNTTTLREALKANGVPDARLEELAILNGTALTDKLSAGMMIKLLASS